MIPRRRDVSVTTLPHNRPTNVFEGWEMNVANISIAQIVKRMHTGGPRVSYGLRALSERTFLRKLLPRHNYEVA